MSYSLFIGRRFSYLACRSLQSFYLDHRFEEANFPKDPLVPRVSLLKLLYYLFRGFIFRPLSCILSRQIPRTLSALHNIVLKKGPTATERVGR